MSASSQDMLKHLVDEALAINKPGAATAPSGHRKPTSKPPNFFKRPQDTPNGPPSKSQKGGFPNSQSKAPPRLSADWLSRPKDALHQRQRSFDPAYGRRNNNDSISSMDSTGHSRSASWQLPDARVLPQGWRVARTPDGRVFFVNMKTQTTSWIDPRTGRPWPNQATQPRCRSASLGSDGKGPLPLNWEQVTSPNGQVYFVDHANKTTTFKDPRDSQANADNTWTVRQLQRLALKKKDLCIQQRMIEEEELLLTRSLQQAQARQSQSDDGTNRKRRSMSVPDGNDRIPRDPILGLTSDGLSDSQGAHHSKSSRSLLEDELAALLSEGTDGIYEDQSADFSPSKPCDSAYASIADRHAVPALDQLSALVGPGWPLDGDDLATTNYSEF
eukprot:TRINITY_DN9835_c0_g1_i1.p1 TRINITY_DN9835_c0_g1~~TRINITY_DN9835_c0_g1_i1.p1  ORF type:complete len:387 (+),score=64.62 TRINITY_DN9835_c0_g1_i1:199-1359(+)